MAASKIRPLALRWVGATLVWWAVWGAAGLAQAQEPPDQGAAVPAPVPAPAQPQVRLKDIARVEGLRENQLYGLGLVVGLDGTGDSASSQANVQMVTNMLARFGVTVRPGDLRLRNAAAVMVTASLPAFARPGDTLDVVVSSFGDARSLQGGVLLQTPLQAADGRVYAVAQGPVSIGGFNVSAAGAGVQKNHAAVGRVPGGAIVEREVPAELVSGDSVRLALQTADFTTAARVAEVINRTFTPGLARAVDRSSVVVRVPDSFREDPVSFLAALEELPVTPDAIARVVINERTGTVVMGHAVRLGTVAVSHGGLSVRVTTATRVSQPPPRSGGETRETRSSRVQAEEQPGRLMVLPAGTNVEQLVAALNAIGATPRDVIAILQAIKQAGALYGELVIL